MSSCSRHPSRNPTQDGIPTKRRIITSKEVAYRNNTAFPDSLYLRFSIARSGSSLRFPFALR